MRVWLGRYSLLIVDCIGEQLAWLRAALRLSPGDEQYRGAWYCLPSVSCLKTPSTGQLDTQHEHRRFEIHFDFEKAKSGPSNGLNRWHSMFRNPIIVRGYPIAGRADINTGLEVPLGTLVQLINMKCVTVFYDKVFIKRFSSMLALIEMKSDLLLWHLFYNDQGGQASYRECKERPSGNFTMSQLEGSRHFVGPAPRL